MSQGLQLGVTVKGGTLRRRSEKALIVDAGHSSLHHMAVSLLFQGQAFNKDGSSSNLF